MKKYKDNGIASDWSIVEAVINLKRKEYILKLRREATCLYCARLMEWILPEDFMVDKYYHFGDIANPDAERILYAISLRDGQKGFLIDACNVYADNLSLEMAQKLKWDEIKARKDDLTTTINEKKPEKWINEALTF